MENEIGYQLSPELIALRENVRRIIKDEVIPAEARVDPDAAEIDEDDYWRIARKVQAAEAVSATFKRGIDLRQGARVVGNAHAQPIWLAPALTAHSS